MFCIPRFQMVSAKALSASSEATLFAIWKWTLWCLDTESTIGKSTEQIWPNRISRCLQFLSLFPILLRRWRARFIDTTVHHNFSSPWRTTYTWQWGPAAHAPIIGLEWNISVSSNTLHPQNYWSLQSPLFWDHIPKRWRLPNRRLYWLYFIWYLPTIFLSWSSY